MYQARTLRSLRVGDEVWIANSDDEAGMYTGPWALVEMFDRDYEPVWRFEPQNCTDQFGDVELTEWDEETPIVAFDEDDETEGVFWFSWIRDPLGLES